MEAVCFIPYPWSVSNWPTNGAYTMQDNWPEASIDTLPDLEIDTATPCAPAAQFRERRKLRRAKMRLRARMRPGQFDDGAFDEVADTINASRKAFYFHTASCRYRAGMRLRVGFPYDPKANSHEDDSGGEVVRVDQKADGYGIAVTFWKMGEAPATATQPRPAAQERGERDERRCHPRHAMVAAIELIDLPTGLRARANTSDMSLGGCYVNTLNPFRLGTTLGVKIEHAGGTIEMEANVCSRFDGSGMGLAFQNVTANQTAMLSDWMPAQNPVFAGYAS
ncbi:MAG: PilZ domain-containing protein [Candidatus Acidiferrales bacterium]